jgi:hypothetical protein
MMLTLMSTFIHCCCDVSAAYDASELVLRPRDRLSCNIVCRVVLPSGGMYRHPSWSKCTYYAETIMH